MANWLINSTSPLISNWEIVVDTAASSGILQSLHKHTHLQLPEEISTLLSTIHSLNTDRNTTALGQSRQLTAALNQIGIQPVALKGLANILAGIYRDLGTRYLADIDLLVPADKFPAALNVFQDLGYSADATHPVEFNIGHTYPPFNRPHSLEIDLHRTLGLDPCPTFLPAAELIKDAQPCGIDLQVCRLTSRSNRLNDPSPVLLLPSPTHLIIHHIMHSQMHDVYHERVAPSLRTLYDFYLLEKTSGLPN